MSLKEREALRVCAMLAKCEVQRARVMKILHEAKQVRIEKNACGALTAHAASNECAVSAVCAPYHKRVALEDTQEIHVLKKRTARV